MEVDKLLKFKSHQRMQVEFISSIVDVMIHDCLSSVALALDKDFNTSFTSSTTESGITWDFQDAQNTLQASDNIQPGANSAMSGSDDTLLPASVTGQTREAAETTTEDQHAPTTEATDGTMPVATTATEPTIEAMDSTMPVVTTATEPTIEATDGTMPVATTSTEPTIEEPE